MSASERFLTQRQRYQPVTLPQDFSDEEMARDWTLTTSDQQKIGRYRARSRLFIANGYYEKAIGIYTHVSDQYSVYSTKAISCNPRSG
uniref:Tn3 family transposase n=1 Tax=Photorhabdus sp. CRCIA-P01 TaxID=2019570 RepID=UPI0018E4E7D9|nr:Tn3 family transposase [Photorhabdus sp. CRCIA-P01]